MQYKKTYEVKNLAKDSLCGHYRIAISICLLCIILRLALNYMFSSLLSPLLSIPDATADFQPLSMAPLFTISALLSYMISTFVGMLNIGVAYFFLKMAAGQNCSQLDLFYAFRQDTGKALGLSAITNGILMVFMLPYNFFLTCFQATLDYHWAYMGLISFAIGMLIYLPLGLTLLLSYYFMLDFPEKSVSEILELCFRKMKGHRIRLLKIILSLIPVMLLGICSLYVGFLWILPYIQMTYVQFYLDLMKPAEA